MRLDEDLNPVPDLAESYEAISDTEWEFKLRQDVKFHDGTSMKAEDVKASLEWAKGFAEVSLYNDNIQSVEVVDDYTVRITTPTPSPVLLFNLTQHGNAIVPKKLIDEGHDFNTQPIGTGPYKFVSWTRGDQVEFEAFEDYYLGEPSIKHVTWKIIPEGSSRTIALEAGEVDLVIEVEAMDVERIQENDKLATIQYMPTSVTWVMLNNEKQFMDNENIRHAINCAIDKESVVTVALNGLGKPALAQMPTNIPGVTEENADQYDVEKAKEWLEKSGVDPAEIKFSIICSDDTKKRAGEVVQANLKEIGIECTLESMDLATYLSATAEGDFVAAIGGYGMSDTISYFNGVFHSKSINASNKSRMNNPEIDALIDQASKTIDKEEREALTTQCAAMLNQICSQAPLYQTISLRAFNADLEGVTINDAGDLRIENISWKK
nr:ABC transporter substrate-binding protein [Intestinimonas sp. MSJ-38]